MERKALSEKIIVLGVDGFEPSLEIFVKTNDVFYMVNIRIVVLPSQKHGYTF